MGEIKPPTDNLYKFFAVSGLVIIGACLYAKHTAFKDMNALVKSFRADEVASLDLIYRLPTSVEWVEPPVDFIRESEKEDVPTVPYIDGSFEDRRTWDDWLANEAYRLAGRVRPPHPNDMPAYFESKAAHAYFRGLKGMSDEEYLALVNGMTYPKFVEITRTSREVARERYKGILQFRQAVNSYWNLRDQHVATVAHANLGYKCGVWISVVGFVGWWWLFQRHQDAILRAQREKETGKPVISLTWILSKLRLGKARQAATTPDIPIPPAAE